jgi:hypothetical protein
VAAAATLATRRGRPLVLALSVGKDLGDGVHRYADA